MSRQLSPAAMPDCSLRLHSQARFEGRPCTAQSLLGPSLLQEKRFQDLHGHLRYPGVTRGLFDNEELPRPSAPFEATRLQGCSAPQADLAIVRDTLSNERSHHPDHRWKEAHSQGCMRHRRSLAELPALFDNARSRHLPAHLQKE